MKGIVTASLLGAALALALPARANGIQVGYPGASYGPYQTGVGGEFTYTDVDGWLHLSGYVAGTTSGFGSISSFQTFCIEFTEHIYGYPSTYDAELSQFAVGGGVGAGASGDPISVGTGWLYRQFARGTLAGYSYNSGDSQRKASADLLQRTIWWLEQEGPDPGSNVFRDAVLTRFGDETGARAPGGTQAYGVYAINLTRVTTGAKAQDGLFYAVPDGGTTLALLGVALAGLGLARRLAKA